MNKTLLLLFVALVLLLTSCGLSEDARKLEETNLELSNRLRRAESVVIPAMHEHIDSLEVIVEANQGVQDKIESANVLVERANNDLNIVVSSIPESVVAPVETILPEQPPKTDDDENQQFFLDSQRQDIERTAQHNDDARIMRETLNKLEDIGASLNDASDNLEGASADNREVTNAISNEVVEIAETTEVIADEIANASALADDAADQARSIRDKADMANIVGGVLTTALGSLPIPGANAITGALPKPDAVVPRSPMDAAHSASDGGGEFPYWLIPIMLGGGGAPFLSKKVRGGVGKMFGKGGANSTQVRPTSGPGQSSDARFLGEALMRLEEKERAEKDAVEGPDVEDKLARILEDRRRRRAQNDQQLQTVAQPPSPQAPRSSMPGQSGVFSLPTGSVG